MKKIILFVLTVAVALGGYAKERGNGLSFGLKAGVNVNNYFMSDVNVYDLNNKVKAGFVLGFIVEKPIKDWFSLETDLLVSMQGSNLFWDNAGPILNLRSSVYYINLPVTANFYIFKGLSVKAGVQPGFKVGADFNKNPDFSDFGSPGACFNRFDLSIPVGLSYDISMFRIEARYAFGLTNVLRGVGQIIGKARNSVWSFTIGVNF